MRDDLFEAFRMSMLNRPEGSRKEARDHFIASMKADPDNLVRLAEEYFDRKASMWAVEKTDTGYMFQRSGSASVSLDDMRKSREAASARTAAALEEMRATARSMILMDLPMPDGKALRDATGAECHDAGGFYREVSKALGDGRKVVGKNLSENDLRNIRARIYQRNKKSAA